MFSDSFTSLWHLPRRLAIVAVRIYQATLSPDHGPFRSLHPHGFCRHSPTCSDYAIAKLQKWGFIVGSLLAIRRILSCNPFHRPSEEKMRALADKQLSNGD